MELVERAELVERVFGRWPSFHDAEVVSILLDRGTRGPASPPTVRLSVHAFEMTSEVDQRGYYVLRNHVLVEFALHSAEVLHLEGFNQQNVLFGLHFSKPAEPVAPGALVQVDLDSSYGVSASFQCARAEVVSVRPYVPPKSAA